jgi:hypothetical protein
MPLQNGNPDVNLVAGGMRMDWGSVPAWLAVLTAISGATVALKQLALATKAQRDQVQIARANLLLSIDGAYEGAEIYKARKALRSLRNRAEAVVLNQVKKNKAPEALVSDICEECSHQLDQLWEKVKQFNDQDVEKPDSIGRIASDRYAELMTLPYWFETVGLLCQRNLLPTDDVLNLYDEVVITTMTSFANHISARRSEGPAKNRRLLENAGWLRKSRAVQEKSGRPSAGSPRPKLDEMA